MKKMSILNKESCIVIDMVKFSIRKESPVSDLWNYISRFKLFPGNISSLSCNFFFLSYPLITGANLFYTSPTIFNVTLNG